MIEKQRLEELIKQCATIYFIYNGNVDLKEGEYKDDFILNESYVSIYWSTRSHQVKYENLFETKEEAEWHKEFGCIERTIKLDLPKWEEIDKDNNFYYIRNYNINKNFSFFIEVYNFTKTITIRWNNGCTTNDDHFYRVWELTKENYCEACRKAKELFLGENNNDE